jgi:hypothetical protein
MNFMKKVLFLLLLLCFMIDSNAQNVYTIKADSVKITNCDSAELIIENHTQGVPGFLYNTGKGRTAFRHALTKINDTLYQVGGDTLDIAPTNAWLQGGNSFGTTGILGTKDLNNLAFYTANQPQALIDPGGHFLIGYTTSSGFKFDVNGPSRFRSELVIVGADPYAIQFEPQAPSFYAPSIDASILNFGGPSIGVNKEDLGNIPANSLVIGGVSPLAYTTLADIDYNPVFVIQGNGATTINGGYNGISKGGSQGNGTNSPCGPFAINGARGTGTGSTGDIVFSTGDTQSSGTTIHAMTNRWWLKGSTGYLSNTSTPTSLLDITGTNGYSQLGLRTTYTPTSSTDTNGNKGDFSWDDSYFYIKTSTGWKRAALTTF